MELPTSYLSCYSVIFVLDKMFSYVFVCNLIKKQPCHDQLSHISKQCTLSSSDQIRLITLKAFEMTPWSTNISQKESSICVGVLVSSRVGGFSVVHHTFGSVPARTQTFITRLFNVHKRLQTLQHSIKVFNEYLVDVCVVSCIVSSMSAFWQGHEYVTCMTVLFKVDYNSF